ncbi:STN domain-containing protein [Corticimicrobacter populi]|uniref:STN domain-containing protein n=1 Tax=Corticimicrobacter populi TaxID=2175229 RepID=UPI00195DE9C2|nr:STN domain-containing protein [Corticimicrobacter populi]
MSKQYMPFRPGILAAAISLALCIPTFWHQEVRAEQGSAEIQAFDLPAAPLAETLNAIAARSDRLISVAPSLTRGLQAPAVRGDLTAEQAVRQALAGSGLVLRVTASGVLTLERAPAADSGPGGCHGAWRF